MELISRKEAHARGLKRYFDGLICPKGHISEKLVVNYTCIKCLHVKELASRKIKRQPGMAARAAMRSAMPSVSSRVAARARGNVRYFSGVPCVHGHLSDRYTRTGFCVKCMSDRGAAYKAQPEGRAKIAASAKRRRNANIELAREKARANRISTVQRHLRSVLRCRIKAAIRGLTKSKSALVYLGCTVPEVRAHLEAQFLPGMSWDNHTIDGWHIDHIRPLVSFDMTQEAERCIAFHYTNLQPLWATDNLRKNARFTPSEDGPQPAEG
jgi:hypothetical protein